MDGSYQNPYHRANSPMSPETPTSAPYRANVNRTKTRKWVEAKTQNYDGDDWGGDDFDDEPEPLPVPPLRPTGSRQTSLSSQTWNQPPPMPQLGPRYASGPQPSLHIQTQPAQPQQQQRSQPQPELEPEQQQQQQARENTPASAKVSGEIKSPVGPEPSSSVYSQGTGQLVSPQSASSGAVTASVAASEPSRFPPRKTSIGQYEPNAAQQQTNLPSDVYRRSEEDRTAKASQSSPIAVVHEDVGGSVGESVASRGVLSRNQIGDTNEGRASLGSTPRGGTPQENAVEGKSDSGFDRTLSHPQLDQEQVYQAPVSASAPAPAPAHAPAYVEQPQFSERFNDTTILAEPQATFPSGRYEVASPTSVVEHFSSNSPAPQEEPRRFSTSPQLPDLARMSMFGDDFFSKPPVISDAPPVPTLREESEPSPQLPSLSLRNSPALDRSATPPETDTTTILGVGQTESPTQPTDAPSSKTEDVSAEMTPSLNAKTASIYDVETREASRTERTEQKRPSFPGGWVTETTTPAAEAEPTTNPIESASTGRPDISPVSDGTDGAPPAAGSVVVKEPRSIPVTLPGAPSDDQVQRVASLGANHSSRSHSPASEEQRVSSTPPPLQTRLINDLPEEFAPPERQSTLSTINSPSPVKESDKLREEIIRTLSPVRPTHDEDAPGDSKGGLSALPGQAARESTYLHGVYDDYWSGPDDRPAHGKQLESDPNPPIPATDGAMLPSPREMSDIPPLSPRSPRRDPVEEPSVTPEASLLPRRFSWEASNEDKPQAAEQRGATASPPSFAIDTSSGPLSQQSPPPAPTVEEPESIFRDDDKPPSSATDELPSRLAQNANMGILDNAALVSHQVSQVSTLPREKQDSVAPEPPSPISVTSDKPPAITEEPEPKRLVEPRRLSLAEEKRPLQVSSSDQTSPLPSPGGHPALAEPPSSANPEAEGLVTQQQLSSQPALPVQPAQKLLSFREILDLPSAADRIAKYNETRAQFAAMDSGLNNWMVGLQSQHPEHGPAASSYQTSVTAGPPGSASAQRSPTNAPLASQQPYYQQYLNASSPAVTPGAPGRPSTGNMAGGGLHSPSSDFKHSSGQVGAKGKELLLGAAKAGKGLLSKGKNKLRGGDKNEESSSSSSPPPPQSKARNDRRASWGLSLGPRSSGPKGDVGPQSHPSQPRRLSTVSSSAPQIPQPLRLSPLDTFPNSAGVPWANSQTQPRTPPNGANCHGVSQPELVSPVSDTNSMRRSQEGNDINDDDDNDDAADKLQVPRPISKTQPTWDPTNATPLFEENDFDLDHSKLSSVPNGRPAAPSDDRDDDWVVVEPQAHGEPYRMVPPEADKSPAPRSAVQKAPSSLAFQSNINQPRQPPPETSPQRNSSFIGLPPIRRSSTFGINYARRAKERFSLDEDEMDNLSRTPTLDAGAGPSTLSSQQQYDITAAQQTGSLPIGTGAQTHDSQQGLAGDTLGASTLGRTASNASSEVDVGDDPEKPPMVDVPYQNRRKAPTQHQNMRPQPGVLGQNEPGENPVQHLPPQGPWKLEESHLSEPLLPASRSRQISDPHQAYFGFDKETGVPTPVPMQQRPTVQMPPRQKFSETPPSSARRYPELFSRAAGQQQQQQQQQPLEQAERRTSQDLPPQVYQQQPPSREDVILQRSNTSEFQVPGVGPPQEEDRGRERRGSGFFKEIGGRFRAASRERRGSTLEGRGPAGQPGGEVRGDEASESSFDTQELRGRKKKRRSSFFMNLRGAKLTNNDGQPGGSGDDTANSSDVAEQHHAQSELQQQFADQRKRSFFGSTSGNGLGLQNLSRTSTSSNMHEPEGSMLNQNSPKKRLSTLTGKFFHRSQGHVEEPPKPMTAQSLTPSLQSRHSGLPNTQPGVPSPLADRARGRSSTTGSRPINDQETYLVGQGAPDDVVHGDRGRRASAGNFLAGLLGNRSPSKTREAHSQSERAHSQSEKLPQHQPQQTQFQMGQRPPQAQVSQAGQQQPYTQPGPQPGSSDARNAGQQPPPFRTQGPPVHPVAGVASPEQRGQSSFPDPYKAPDNTRISVKQVEPETDEADSGVEQHVTTPAVSSQANPDVQLSQPPLQTQPGPDLGSQPSRLLPRTGPSTDVSPNASPVLSSNQHQANQVPAGQDDMMPFSPDHVFRDQQLSVHQGTGSRPDANFESVGRPEIHKQPSGADLQAPREQFSSSPQLNNGHPPPPSEISLQDRRVSHLSVGSFQEPSAHSSPSLPSQVDARGQRPVSISPVPQGLRQPTSSLTQTRDSAPLFLTQSMGQRQSHHGLGPGQAQGPGSEAAGVLANSQEPQDHRRSRWLMGKSSQQSIQQSQPKPEKEKSSKSLFSAFKRSSKLPPVNQVQPDLAAYRTNSHQQHQQMMQGRPHNMQHAQQQNQVPFEQPRQLPHGPAPQLAQSQAPPLSQPQPSNGHGPFAPHHLYQQQRMSAVNVPVPGQFDSRRNSYNSQHQPHGHSPEIGQRNAQRPPQPIQSNGQDRFNAQLQHDRVGYGPGGQQQLIQNAPANPNPRPSQHSAPQQQQQTPGFVEPQYDQVPIPRGYSAVHGEGNIEPSPYAYGRRVSGGFQRTSFEQQPSNDAANRRQFSAEQVHRPYSQTQQVPRTMQHAVSPPLGHQSGGFRDSMASSRSSYYPPQAGQHGSPAMRSGPAQQVGLGLDRPQAGYGERGLQVDVVNGQCRRANQHLQQQQQAVVQSSSSPQPAAQQNGYARPPQPVNMQGQLRAASNISINTGMSSMAVQEQPPQQHHASRHVPLNAPRGSTGVSNSNPSTPAGRNLNINVQSANQGDHDDIYDSTPRRPAEPLRPTKTGDSQVSAGSNEEQQALQAQREAEAETAAATARTTLIRGKSTRAELEDTEDERKRSIRLEAQEEKILYDPDEDNAPATDRDAARRDLDAPLMSATSYPGMEWNPYMVGGYDEMDEPVHK